MNKTIHTLVDDIYRLMETKEAEESVDVEAEIDKFGESMKSLMRTEFARDRKRDGPEPCACQTLVGTTDTFGT